MGNTQIMRYVFIIMLVIESGFAAQAIPEQSADRDYFRVTGPCGFEFPDDHGEHPGYRTEWWYYTGNVFDAEGHHFGFQLTFFRSQMVSNQAMEASRASSSHWRSGQLYFAHAALSNMHQRRFLNDNMMARGALKLAGVNVIEDGAHVFLKNWSATITSDGHQLICRSDEFAFKINLKPLKAIVYHGNKGYSKKGRSPERASCYYSYTRLQAEGTITTDKQTYTIYGNAWMDHEYSSAPLEPTAIGWDWFSLQMDDQSELMLFMIREENGGVSPASGGTYIDAQGKMTRLTMKQVRIKVVKKWQSPTTKAFYPAQWQIDIPELKLGVNAWANLDDQELITTESTGVTYWEGSVSFRGENRSRPLGGHGYVELTGYDVPFRSPL